MSVLNKTKIFFILLLIPGISMAAPGDARSMFMGLVFAFINYIGFVLGFYILLYTIVTLATRYMDRDREVTIGKITLSLVVASVLMNISGTINTMLVDLRGGDTGGQYCFVYEVNDESFRNLPVGDSCYNVEASPLAQEYVQKINDQEDRDAIFRNIRFGLSIFQVIGLIYFIVGFNLLRKINMGKEQGGYFKPIIMILFSALLIDLPHTITVGIDLLQQLELFGFKEEI